MENVTVENILTLTIAFALLATAFVIRFVRECNRRHKKGLYGEKDKVE
jgi:hypothetical protein